MGDVAGKVKKSLDDALFALFAIQPSWPDFSLNTFSKYYYNYVQNSIFVSY